MVGDGTRPLLKTKAAETGVLVQWAVHFVQNFEKRLRRADLMGAAGECLIDYIAILKRNSFRMPWDECNCLLFQCLRHLNLMNQMSGDFMPKAHMFLHLTRRCVFQGNARMYSCFVDEKLNLALAGIASASHRSTWEVSIFQRIRLLPLVQPNCAFAAFA